MSSSVTKSPLQKLRREVEDRQRELRILSKVASRIHSEDTVDGVLGVALDELLDGMGLKAGWVFLGDGGDATLRLAAHRGISPGYLQDVQKNGLGNCLCPEVFSTAHPLQVRNTTECPRMPSIVAGLNVPVAHACIPLALDGTSRGVLNVAANLGQVFDADELRFLETVGRQVCLAVERARHLHAERLHNQEARALASLNKRIGEMLDTDAVLRGVGQTALEVLSADRVHILLGSDPRELEVAHLAGLAHPELRERQVLDLVELGASLQQQALLGQETCRLDDWSQDDRANRDLARRWDVGAALVMPLVARRTTLGLLVITKREPHSWTDDQVDVAEALASQASVAIENAHLYEKARRAYRELNEAQARIIQSEKMAVVGTFASGLAHEVRNPLNSIALQLSILERRVAPLETGVSGELKELLGIIREEVKRLDNLVGDFLQFSRANRIHYRPTNVDGLLDEVMRLLRPEARAAGVVLRRERAGAEIPDLRVDAEKIKQVAINLVQNAIEAMPGGGTAVVESGVQDGHAQIVVRDTGPGLPEGLDVFQLFVTTKARGTGLGLSIAQQIVLEHGGDIAAESAPGSGATFTVRLPLASPEEPELERP
jgi:signal transduction histidine kinase